MIWTWLVGAVSTALEALFSFLPTGSLSLTVPSGFIVGYHVLDAFFPVSLVLTSVLTGVTITALVVTVRWGVIVWGMIRG